jgi:hypothetical protein
LLLGMWLLPECICTGIAIGLPRRKHWTWL